MSFGSRSKNFRVIGACTSNSASNDFAMFGPVPVGSGSGLRLAARTGAFAPGAPGSTFSGFLAPSVNSVHEVAFWGSYTGSGLLALFVGVPGSDPGTISTLPYGNLSHIFSVGDAAEGFVPGVTYSTFTMDSTPQVPINATGQIIYRGTVTGPGIGAANDDAIWGGTPGSTHRIAVAGDPAGSGTIGGGINGWNSTFLTPVLTDSGAVAYLNFIVGSPTGSNFGIYRSISLGGPDRVARVGDLAPGPGPSGPTHVYAGTFSSLDSGSGNGVPRMNNLNGVTFRAAITGAGVTAANDVGIWGHNDAGVLGLVVRESDAVPAAGAGVTLATIAPQPPCLNGVNRVAFRATLAGTGVTAANDEAILATNRMNQLVVAAREGVGIEVAPGVVRTLLNFRAITGPGTQDGNSTSWNDKCELVFHATLNDGREGIFVSDVNATCRPTITAQPTDATSCRGGTAMFTVAATSPSSGGLASVPTYQWRKDSTAIPGASTSFVGLVPNPIGAGRFAYDDTREERRITGRSARKRDADRIAARQGGNDNASTKAGVEVRRRPCATMRLVARAGFEPATFGL